MYDEEWVRRAIEHPDIVRMMRDGLLDRSWSGEASDREDDWEYTFEEMFL